MHNNYDKVQSEQKLIETKLLSIPAFSQAFDSCLLVQQTLLYDLIFVSE